MISSNEVMYVITEIKDHFDEKIILHMHNDRGLVKATALAGIEAGASAILGTFAGIGERSGNVPLEEVIKNLSDKYDVQLKANTRMIRELCQLVQQYTGVYVHPHKPICGKSVLTHKAGIHLHAIQKIPENYELFPPEEIGEVRRFVFGKHNGVSHLKYLFGRSYSDPQYKKMLEYLVMQSQSQKKDFDEEEVRTLFQEAFF